MYAKRRYSFRGTISWSYKPFLIGFFYTLILCSLSHHFHVKIYLPWQPIGVVGIAVAFYLGFKNNSSYDRTWEARKIWGSIVNNSRSFGAAVLSFIQGEDSEKIKKELIYRHIAWLTALRTQLRLSKDWEHTEDRLHDRFAAQVCPKYKNKLGSRLESFMPADEVQKVNISSNGAVQILKNQSLRLQELRNENYFDDFRHMALFDLVENFYTDQGKSERIKNFPFPRQYASTGLWLNYVFCVLAPFGLMSVFNKVEGLGFWLCPLISALVFWVFF